MSLYPAAIPVPRRVPRPSVRSPSVLLAVLHTPRTLAAFVAFVAWPDLHSLLSTCSSLRSALFAHMPTRDVVLARFVPAFSFCLAHRDMQFFQDVPITVHDLDLLLISNRTDLHRYPTHALRTLTAPALVIVPTRPDPTTKLVKLTQAHSRFVLLFQSLVHSSTQLIPPDPPEDKYKSPDPSPQLTFPPPLAFTNDSPPPPPPKDPPTFRRKHKNSYSYSSSHISRKSSASPYMVAPSNSSPLSHPYNPSISSTQSLPARAKQKKTNRCLSMLCISEPSSTPPLPEEPQTLQVRSKEWRRPRSTSITSASAYSPSPRPPIPTFNHRPNHSSSLDFGIYLNSYPSDTDFEIGQLRRPNRLFAPEQQHHPPRSSSSSFISIPETRSSWNQGQGSITSSRSSPPVSPHGHTPPRVPYQSHRNPNFNPPFAPSIHSLLHATIRNRAPILRVFVPTQYMLPPGAESPTPQSSSNSSPERAQSLSSLTIQACEAQLQESGLWDHLSTGDVICNLGYIPLDDNPSNSSLGGGDLSFPPGLSQSQSVYTPKVLSPSHRPSLRSFTQHPHPQAQHRKTWLIFTGNSLLPYTPPSLLPLPSSSPLTLPSPFYYYHILPQGTNPLFEIPQLPPLSSSNISLSLIKTTSLIPSTISHTGFAKVNKFAWTARVVRSRPQAQLNNPFGHLFNPDPNADASTKPLPAPPPSQFPPPIEQLGDGWIGEWVVEYEGTSEGRQVLLAALEGKKVLEKGKGKEIVRKVWEVRRERSGGGRVWMRLLPE